MRKEPLEENSHKPFELIKEKFEQILNSKKLVVVEFYSAKCPKCFIEMSSYEMLAERYDDRIVFSRFNILNSTDNKRVADRYHVLSVPTYAIFKNDKLLDRLVNPSIEDLKKLIMSTIN
ncbi:MAG: thioredoxin family protein [Candidatus Methylarchaceae archaeon HK02M2]|nr:thioredoxin family protein [Candidatus Methylarchaceae archaeon HK02M2]